MKNYPYSALFLVAATLTMVGASPLVHAETLEGLQMRVEQNEELYSVYLGGQRVFRYRIAPNPYKPYVDYLVTPSGRNLLRDAPADHLHHHGLMFAVRANGVNFWEEHQQPGTQAHEGHIRQHAAQTAEDVTAGIGHRVHWMPYEDGGPILVEERDLELRSARDENEPTLLTWRARFTAPEGQGAVEISGAHYHGLGARFLAEMDQDGAFLTPADESADPEHVRGSEQLARAPWQAYQSEAEGGPVTFAMFCHPGNYRHPAWWFQMDDPFAYLSATMYVHEDPFELADGDTLTLTYGVALWDGHPGEEVIQAAYDKWLNAEDGG